jgi:hypothetical protein
VNNSVRLRMRLIRNDLTLDEKPPCEQRFYLMQPEHVQRSLASLREVSAIVDAKAPDEAASFKTWLREISQKVAEAAVEGSFLGFGGVRVSDAEAATLRDISKALGVAS